MGSSSGKDVKGGMHLQVENKTFNSGDDISGIINVMLEESLPPCTLYLQLKGIEKTH